jgi:rubredoxin
MTDYHTRRRGGELFILWTCPACGEDNDRILNGVAWRCLACGYIDREIESASADLYTAEQQTATVGDAR